jgi:hypothetical protein
MGRRNPESAAAATAGPSRPPRPAHKPTPPKPPKPPPVPYTPGTDPDAEEQQSVHEVYERIAPHFAQTRYKVGLSGPSSCPSKPSRTSVLSVTTRTHGLVARRLAVLAYFGSNDQIERSCTVD